MSDAEYGLPLGAAVAIPANEDGSYTCTCGAVVPSALALFLHREQFPSAHIDGSGTTDA